MSYVWEQLAALDWPTVKVTLRLALWTTGVLLVLGLPAAWFLATRRFPGKSLLEAGIALPLVLPPTVLGFYLLMALGPQSPLGRWWEELTGWRLPFTFTGVVIASVLANVPFAMRPFMDAFSGVDRRLVEAARTLGASSAGVFWRVVLPVCLPGILSGVVLTFAHTVGEFGVVLMVGGNLPGVTRTMAIAIYDDVQVLNYTRASWTAGVLLAFAFGSLCVTSMLGKSRWRV